MFLARLGYDNEERVKRFLSDEARARDCTLLITKRMTEDKKKQEWLYEVARSEDRRVRILEAMLYNDMDKVCQLLRVAIEQAYEKERK